MWKLKQLVAGDEEREESFLEDESDGICSLSYTQVPATFPISIFSPQNSFFGSQLMWDFFNSYRECMHLLHACLLAWSVCSWYDHLCSFHLLILSRKQMGLCVYMKFLLFIVLAFWKQEFLVKSWIADKQATKQIADYILDS